MMRRVRQLTFGLDQKKNLTGCEAWFAVVCYLCLYQSGDVTSSGTQH